MNKLYAIAYLLFSLSASLSYGQIKSGVVRGLVTIPQVNTPVEGARVSIYGDTLVSYTGADGRYEFEAVPVGYRTLRVFADGYPEYTSASFEVTSAIPSVVDAQLTPISISTVVVTGTNPLRQTVESPVAMRKIGREEIDLTPGANRDISKVVQSAPGVVAVSANNRNDLLVRGGGANENKYLLDGIEIPVLNHFSVQGGSGGYASLVNTDLLGDVNFYTGAFPASSPGALSSVLDMKMKNGNSERFHGKLVAGASDVGVTIDTPISKNGKTTLIGSYRRSYLQFLFGLLKLPFLPTYNDYQFKVSSQLSENDELFVIGLGSFDNNKLNLGIENPSESRKYILGYLPNNDQFSYVFGAGYRHNFTGGQLQITVSRDYLKNSLFKYLNNDISQERTLDIDSREANYRLRAIADWWNVGGFRIRAGLGGGYGSYRCSSMQAIYNQGRYSRFNTYSDVDLWRYDAFATISRYLFDSKLSILFGLRLDAMTYSSLTVNPLKQLSPRLSLSYRFTDKWSLNGTVARYYQEPTYTTMGYMGQDGGSFDQRDGLKYMNVNQYVAGVKFSPNSQSSLTLEGFFKQYGNMPVSLVDSLPVSTGDLTDYIVGNVPARSVGKGRAYGMELSYRNLNFYNTVINVSYTLLYSQVNKLNDAMLPVDCQFWNSSWDVRHILNISAIHKFRHSWTLGFKWYLTGGLPYTPYDIGLSSQIDVWDNRGRPVTDNLQYNTGRTALYHQLDVRVDKVWNFDKWRLGFYIDIQNLYNFEAAGQDIIMPQTDANGQYIVDPNNPGNYLMQTVTNNLGGTILPTLGLTIEI